MCLLVVSRGVYFLLLCDKLQPTGGAGPTEALVAEAKWLREQLVQQPQPLVPFIHH